MNNDITTILLAALGVAGTSLVAWFTLDLRRREMRQGVAAAIQDDATKWLEQQSTRIDDQNARIAHLEAQVNALTREVRSYQQGLVAPDGYVVIPAHTWARIRESLAENVPIMPGEIRPEKPPAITLLPNRQTRRRQGGK